MHLDSVCVYDSAVTVTMKKSDFNRIKQVPCLLLRTIEAGNLLQEQLKKFSVHAYMYLFFPQSAVKGSKTDPQFLCN